MALTRIHSGAVGNDWSLVALDFQRFGMQATAIKAFLDGDDVEPGRYGSRSSQQNEEPRQMLVYFEHAVTAMAFKMRFC